MKDALNYVKNNQETLIQLIKDLCAIPSFSHKEEQKAKFIKEWFLPYTKDVYIDDKYNVIVPMNIENNNELVVFMAHIDTVFPDEVGFQCTIDNGRLCAPGVGDDTANVAELMLIAKYILENNYICDKGCLFVFNSCEEGLGNLEGSKHLLSSYKDRVSELYSFDGTYSHIVNKAVGSSRYKINIKTKGGHSYGAFGNTNAIAYASSIIADLYTYKVPTRGTSTYNVGVIEGGTSVNTIAQDCSFLYEFRSDDRYDLEEMNQYFYETLKKYEKEDVKIHVEVLGNRPCMGDVDADKINTLVQKASDIITLYTNTPPILESGSTDCNMSYSLGIEGCCFGGYLGRGAHTREEYIEIDSLEIGMSIVMHFILTYFTK